MLFTPTPGVRSAPVLSGTLVGTWRCGLPHAEVAVCSSRTSVRLRACSVCCLRGTLAWCTLPGTLRRARPDFSQSGRPPVAGGCHAPREYTKDVMRADMTRRGSARVLTLTLCCYTLASSAVTAVGAERATPVDGGLQWTRTDALVDSDDSDAQPWWAQSQGQVR
jgi:hypothetical protein